MNTARWLSGSAIAMAGVAFCSTALAQPDQNTAPASTSQNLEPEIIVTAQRRSQRLQDIPMSVSVVSGESVETERATSVDTLARFVPNFQAAGLTALQPQLTIRGIGTNDRQAGSDQSVVVFVDEQYIGRSSATVFSLLDINRIEVLRGPQGTLFGRNVSGGAISVNTNRPSDRFEGMVSASTGNLELWEGQGMINVPLSDTIALRAAGSARTRNGYYENIYLGGRAGDRESLAGRVQLQVQPSNNITALLSLEAYRDEVDGLGTKIIRGDGVSDADYAGAVGNFNLAANPYVIPDSRPFDVANNIFGHAQSSGLSGRARLEWSGSDVQAIVLTGFRNNDLREDYDAVGIAIVGTGAASRGFNSGQVTEEDYSAFNFEARLQSANSGNALQWVAGVNYLREDIHRDVVVVRQSNNAFSQPRFDQRVITDSYAFFGDLTWRFMPDFELTMGGRYTIDKKGFDLAVSRR